MSQPNTFERRKLEDKETLERHILQNKAELQYLEVLRVRRNLSKPNAIMQKSRISLCFVYAWWL